MALHFASRAVCAFRVFDLSRDESRNILVGVSHIGMGRTEMVRGETCKLLEGGMRLKTLQNVLKVDKEKYTVPRCVRDTIPVSCIYEDGIFKTGNRFSKTFRFQDINYQVAGKEDKEKMFMLYCELLNSFDNGATTKLTIWNRQMTEDDFTASIFMEYKEDGLDDYRREYKGCCFSWI